MIKLARVALNLSRLPNSSQYFATGGSGRRSHFRDDVRAIVGGALALAFVFAPVATFIAEHSQLSGSFLTILAGGVGAVVGKVFLA